ncbi:MAG: hypothetical protein ACR2KE_00280 [Candidatus Nanopelagicales bacterium]
MRLSRMNAGAAALFAGVLAGALMVASPAAYSADVASAAVPSSAFVRIDGGTAYAKKTGKHRYTVSIPKGAGVKWLGEAGGKPDQYGTFTPSKLTKAWTLIGHAAGVGVQSTITWRKAGTDYTSFTDALVSDPRVNGKGELVFSARTVGGTLPHVLPDFSFNISSAPERPRKYPHAWGIWLMTNTLGFKPSATGDTSAQVDFSYLNSPNNWVSCSGFYKVPVLSLAPSSLPTGATQGNVAYNGFSCNDVTILSGPSTYVAWSPMQPGGRTSMLPCWTLKVNSTTSLPACNSQSFSWSSGPSAISPA